MKNKLTDVRNHLIAAMEELLDANGEIGQCRLEELQEVNKIGKTLVESAKAEASYVGKVAQMHKQTDGYMNHSSHFIESKETKTK